MIGIAEIFTGRGGAGRLAIVFCLRRKKQQRDSHFKPAKGEHDEAVLVAVCAQPLLSQDFYI
jgi:hypothetical protein